MTNFRLLLSSRGPDGTISTFPLLETRSCDTFRVMSGPNNDERLDRYRRWVERLNFPPEEKEDHLQSLDTWLDRCARSGHQLKFSWE